MLSRLATENTDGQYSALILDISSAFLYGDARRAVYIELPAESQPQDGRVWVGKLERSLYGTRDAPQIWHDHLSDTLRAMGFKASKLKPGMFFHPSKRMELAVHVNIRACQ